MSPNKELAPGVWGQSEKIHMYHEQACMKSQFGGVMHDAINWRCVCVCTCVCERLRATQRQVFHHRGKNALIYFKDFQDLLPSYLCKKQSILAEMTKISDI